MDADLRQDLEIAQQHLLSAATLLLSRYREPAVFRFASTTVQKCLEAVNCIQWMLNGKEDE